LLLQGIKLSQTSALSLQVLQQPEQNLDAQSPKLKPKAKEEEEEEALTQQLSSTKLHCCSETLIFVLNFSHYSHIYHIYIYIF
jgi:hypothetical protein